MRGFTLIEMLVATVLSAVLMAAVLSMLGGVARDRALLRTLRPTTADAIVDLLEWDVRNARTLGTGDGDAALVLTGNDGIDRATLRPDGRLVRVTYRAVAGVLWRQQVYLDDAARPAPWQEEVAADFQSLSMQPAEFTTPPPRVRISVVTGSNTQAREVFTR